MLIYAKLNENKSLQAYSSTAVDGYKELTIDAGDAHFLGEYYNLMWADDNNLVHADNIPATSYEKKIAAWETQIDQDKSDVSNQLQAMQSKIADANNIKNDLDAKLASANTQLAQVQQITMLLQANLAKLSSNTSEAN